MRIGNENTEQYDDDGRLVMISLGAGHTAEHEWGIEKIKNALEIPNDDGDRGVIDRLKEPLGWNMFGIRRRQISNANNVHLFKLNASKATLYFCSYFYSEPSSDYAERVLGTRHNKEKKFVTGWSESDFGVMAFTKEAVAHLEDLYNAFQKKDVAIWLGGIDNPFANGHLCLGIISRISDNFKKEMADQDEQRHLFKKRDLFKKKVLALEEETGVREKLKEAGKKWFALSPQGPLINQLKGRTKYDIMYWLNPMDQKRNRSGWVTIEDLLDWAEDKGVILHKDNTEKYASKIVREEV